MRTDEVQGHLVDSSWRGSKGSAIYRF